MKKGVAPILIILIITAILSIGSGVYVIEKSKQNSKNFNKNDIKIVPTSKPQEPKPEAESEQNFEPIKDPEFSANSSSMRTTKESLGPLGCLDSDEKEPHGGIFIPGTVELWNPRTETAVQASDVCESRGTLIEQYCEPSYLPLKKESANYVVPATRRVPCADGCNNGYCNKPDDVASYSNPDQLGPLKCLDPDGNEPNNGIYAPSIVKFWDPNTEFIREDKDTCYNGRTILEKFCDPAILPYKKGPGSIIDAPTRMIDCPMGCGFNTCIAPITEFKILLNSSSIPSSLIDYAEGSGGFQIHLTLTNVTVGELTAKKYMNNSEGGFYDEGKKLKILILYFTLRSGTIPSFIETPIRRIINEQGNEQLPYAPYFSPPNPGQSSMFEEKTTYHNQEVTFIIPENEKIFYFKSGKTSNLIFSITINNNDTITVKNESAPAVSS